MGMKELLANSLQKILGWKQTNIFNCKPGMEINKNLHCELFDDDSAVKDVALVGIDGGRVMASKAILAIQSPVFRRMFYGNFREADKSCDSVNLNYSTSVLRGIVSYCYINRLDFDWFHIVENDAAKLGALNKANAMDLVRVRDAANYFALPKLHEYITKVLLRPEKGIDCFMIKSVVAKEMRLLEDTEGKLWSSCSESEDALSAVVSMLKVVLAIFREIMIRENNEEYIWSTRVERELMEIAYESYSCICSVPLEPFCQDSVVFLKAALKDKKVINWEALSSYIEKEKNKIETFLSRVDSVVCNSAELGRNFLRKKLLGIDPFALDECTAPDPSDLLRGSFKNVVLARVMKKEFLSKEDEALFEAEVQKDADALLESMENMLAGIHKAMLHLHKGPIIQRPCETWT